MKAWLNPFRRDRLASTATVWMASPSSTGGQKTRLTTVNQETLRYLEFFFGSFCVFLLVLAVVEWIQGKTSLRSPLIIAGFVIANIFFYHLSLRSRKPQGFVLLQPILGGILCPLAYLLVDGVLSPWWPGYAVMCLSGVIILGLTTGNPLWGRLLLFFYLINITLTTWLGLEKPHWHEFFLRTGMIGIVGLMLVQIMAILSQSLTKVYERSLTLRQAKEDLQELDRLKTDFFANVSHEFRTPITLTLGPLEGMLRGRFGELSESLHHQLQIMERNQQRLLGLINQILDVAKAEAGATELKAAKVNDMNRFILERAEQFRPLAEERGLMLKLSLDPVVSGMELYIDREKFDKILFNLLSNALKFTSQGVIEVSTEIQGENFLLTVTDTGQGIKAEELPHIFERFRQADGSASRKYEGTGLGLALVHEFSKLHGGEVSVQSTYGKGSAFQVKIPLGKAHLKAESVMEFAGEEAKEERSPFLQAPKILKEGEAPALVEEVNREAEAAFESEKPTVLYVDDNPELRYYVRDLLRDDYNVFLGSNGKEGLDFAKKHHPDLILSDVMMPEMTGDELCRKIREDSILQSIPVVLLTARSLQESKLEGLAKGADDYLTKPFSETELLARVKNLVNLRQQQVKLKRELEAARAIQFSLLPPPSQKFEEVSLELLYQPSEELSGDFCDIVPRGEWLYFYVADVTSHGTASAQVTYLLKEIFQQAIQADGSNGAPSLPEVVTQAGKQYASHPLPYDVGIQMGRFHPKRRILEYIRGNAPPAVLVKKEGTAQVLAAKPGPSMSGSSAPNLDEHSFLPTRVDLEAGDGLFFFTDGCFEFSAEGRPFGLKRLTELLKGLGRENWKNRIRKDLTAAHGSSVFPDDLTMLRVVL